VKNIYLRFFKFYQPKATGGGFLIFEWSAWIEQNSLPPFDDKVPRYTTPNTPIFKNLQGNEINNALGLPNENLSKHFTVSRNCNCFKTITN
jgi:hypothetical protein